MDTNIKKQFKIFGFMLLIGFALIGVLSIINHEKPQELSIVEKSLPDNIRSIKSPQISWNNVALYDSTEYDNLTNTCTAFRYGMNVTIYPCVAHDVDGKEIEQGVTFRWNGATQRNISWIFVYDYALDSGKISAYLNQSVVIKENQNTWVNNYLVDKVTGFVNLTYIPPYCDLGNLNNTQFYNVSRTTNNATTYTQTICFTSRTIVNATSFRISGNADLPQDKIIYQQRFVDVTNQIQYLGKGLLNDNRSYYKIEDVTFNPNQEIETKWQFTPKDATKRGKWHILGYDSNVGLVQSVINDQYIYIDPWWSASWSRKKQILLQENSGTALVNYTANFTVTYDSDMQTDFDDLRFVDSAETTEYPYWIEYKTDSTSANVHVRIKDATMTASQNTTIYMYYGNAGASSGANKNNTFLFNDDFGGATLDATKWATQTESGSVAVSNGLAYLHITASSKNVGILSRNYTVVQPAKMTFNATFINQSGAYRFRFGLVENNNVDSINYGNRENYGTTGAWGQFGGANNMMWEHGTYTDSAQVYIPPYTFIPQRLVYVQVSATNRSYYINGTLQKMTTANYASLYPAFYIMSATTNPVNITLADLRVQAYATREPTATFGAEQMAESISVTLNTPLTSYKTNNTNVTFNYTIAVAGTNITNWTLFVWYSSNNSIAHQHESGVLNLNSTLNVIHSDTLFVDNSYIWNVRGCSYSSSSGTHLCTFDTNRTFQVHTTTPQFILNSLPNVTTIYLPTNNTINVTTTDPQLSICQYWTSESATRITYTCNVTQLVNFTSGGVKTIYVWANDTYGNFNQTSYNFSLYYINATQYENADPIAEGTTGEIYLLVNSTSFDIGDANASITWNGTQYAPTSKTVVDANSIRFLYSYPVLAGYGNSSGKAYQYNWTYNTSVLTQRTTPTATQTVISFAVDNCAVYTDQIANFTLKDEEMNTLLYAVNSTATLLEIEAIITSRSNTDVSWSYSQSFVNATSIRLCVPTGVINSTNFTIDMTLGFEGTNHVREFWYLDNGTLDNTQYFNTYTPHNISLMDLLTADSTTFLFEFTDENGLEVPDAIVHVFRKYIGEGIFREVERSRQDVNGQTHVHLVEEDVIYYFVVTQNGEILYTSETYNAKCLSSPCEISLSASPSSVNWSIIDNEGGQYSVTSNKNTRVVTTQFSLTSIDLVNVSLYELSNGETRLVNTSSLSATAGSIPLTVPLAYGNKTFFVAIYNNNEFVKSEWVDLTDRGRDYFGTTGAILGGLIVLAIMLMAVSEGIGFFIFTALALIVVAIMKLVDLGWLSLISIICASGIIVYKLIKRRQQA